MPMPSFSRSALVATALAVVLLALLWLYAAPQTPLRPGEVDAYMGAIAAQTQQPGGRHDRVALRRFLEADDGAPFYTVNLYDFRDVAHYEDGARYEDGAEGPPVSGRDAFDRFSAVMIRLLARQASHPVFGTRWSDGGISRWDRLVIVRYRSRRDIAEVFASDAFADASDHKWAALERNERLLVQGLQVPELTLPLALLAAAALVYAFVRQLQRSRRPAAPALRRQAVAADS